MTYLAPASSAIEWLLPLRSSVPELNDHDWDMLEQLDDLLSRLTATSPAHAETTVRRAWLLDVRTRLAGYGYTELLLPVEHGGMGRPAVLQALEQFICGYHDLDLRDAIGLGHGAMAVELASSRSRRVWLDRLAGGALVGIAATELHGGSRFREITTQARIVNGHTWMLWGEKVWVSRIEESRGFVVFFRDPAGSLSAALIDADHGGLEREPFTPAGLNGWSWGTLTLREVDIDPRATLIGHLGAGADVFDRHFTQFRPLVTATALGAAAEAHTTVARTLTARRGIGIIDRVRDNALIVSSRAHGEITCALLMAIATTRLAAANDPIAVLWSRIGKAVGVDIAQRAVTDLLPLVGASGFRADSPLIKARNDIAAFAFADGIADALLRSGGKRLLDQ